MSLRQKIYLSEEQKTEENWSEECHGQAGCKPANSQTIYGTLQRRKVDVCRPRSPHYPANAENIASLIRGKSWQCTKGLRRRAKVRKCEPGRDAKPPCILYAYVLLMALFLRSRWNKFWSLRIASPWSRSNLFNNHCFIKTAIGFLKAVSSSCDNEKWSSTTCDCHERTFWHISRSWSWTLASWWGIEHQHIRVS